MKKRRIVRRPGPRTPAQKAWASSARFRETGRAMCKKFQLRRRMGPKCGAKTKRDGHPCQHPAMTNGKCYRHGGKTPSGDAWHTPLWPDPTLPNASAKLSRKVRDRERAAKRRAERLANMTPEERARHEEWQRTHGPGSAAQRRAHQERIAAKQREIADAEWFRASLARPSSPEAPEIGRPCGVPSTTRKRKEPVQMATKRRLDDAREAIEAGAPEAVRALREICRNPKAPAPARATAGAALLRAAGLFEKTDHDDEKTPAEMSGVELRQRIAKLQAQAEALECRPYDWAGPTDDGEDDDRAALFD